MLPKKNRITSKKNHSKIFGTGKIVSIKEGKMILRLYRGDLSEVRVGIVVGKSYSPKAVERNRMKRLMREAIQESLGLISPGWKIIVHYKKKKRGSAPQLRDLIKEIKALLIKSGLIKIK